MIPATLSNQHVWFCWRMAHPVDRDPFKMPVQVNGQPAMSTDRGTWSDLASAQAALTAHKNWNGLAVGLGFGYWGIDLDHVVTDGEIEPWAREVISRADSYTEFSQSGSGVHILVKGDLSMEPGVKVNINPAQAIEFYNTARYFAFTGKHVPGTPTDLQDRTAVFKALRAEFEALRPSSQRVRLARRVSQGAGAGKVAGGDAKPPVSLTDEEIVARASSGPSGEAFAALMAGDLSAYNEDHSAGDMALVGRLCFWTGRDAEQIDRILRTSGLMRAKWDTRRGLSTYGEQTIEIAIANCEETYSGPDQSSVNFVDQLKARRAAKVAKAMKVGETVKLGSVKDQERGADKPAHTGEKTEAFKRAAADNSRDKSPAKSTVPTDRVITDNSPDNSRTKAQAERTAILAESTLGPDIVSQWYSGKMPPLGHVGRITPDAGGIEIEGDLFSGADGLDGWGGPDTVNLIVGKTMRDLSNAIADEDTRALLLGRRDVNGVAKVPEPDLFMASITSDDTDHLHLDDGPAHDHSVVKESSKVYVGHTLRETLTTLEEQMLPETNTFTGTVNKAEPVNIDLALLSKSAQKLSTEQAEERIEEYVAQSDVDYEKHEEVEQPFKPTPRVMEEPDDYMLTDLGNVDRFRGRFAGQIIFTKSAGWLRWDGKRWVLGNEYATRAAATVAVDIVTLGNTDPRLTQERKIALTKWGIGTQNGGKLHMMTSLAADMEPFTMYEISLDKDNLLLNAPNGIIDLATGALMPHDHVRFMTKMVAIDFDPDAHSDLWDEVIEQATAGQDGLAEFLQRAAGYTLTGITSEDAVFFLHGPGGTAKSSIGEAIKAMMGSYATSMRAEALTTQGNSGHNDDIAQLVGARMVITGEADKADKMRDGLFKRLSGGDTIAASRKGKTGFTFHPQFKMWFITNTVPALNPDDSGIWRRVFKLPFEHVIQNPDRRVRIALQSEARHQKAILAWAVRGAVTWRSVGLGMPQIVKNATELLRRSMDGCADFFDQRCYINLAEAAKLYTSSKDLMEAYTQWANEEGLSERLRVSGRRLGQGLMARGCTPRATMRERGWRGVILKADES